MKDKYPKYYKDVSKLTEIDVYQTHELFQVQDYSGCLHHASKKILLPGVRTGGKERAEDIREARDTLTRWLQINDADTEDKKENKPHSFYPKQDPFGETPVLIGER